MHAGGPSSTAQLHRWPFASLQDYCVNNHALIPAVCAWTQETATPFDPSAHLSELRLSDDMRPVVPSQTEVPACPSSRDKTSGDSTPSYKTIESTRTYGSDSTRPWKKRKTGTPAERVQPRWGLELEEFPELKQAALGQWPPKRSKGQEPAASQAMIGQLPKMHSADASDSLPGVLNTST